MLTVAAANEAVEHALTRVWAEIGIEQADGFSLQDVHFVNSTQHREYFIDVPKVVGGKSTLAVRTDTDRVDLSIG